MKLRGTMALPEDVKPPKALYLCRECVTKLRRMRDAGEDMSGLDPMLLCERCRKPLQSKAS
jgi:predicted SprT family Zn-dependent metalloprotease